ncbi:multiprotein-bridging factor 1 family protein [Hansschlegelia quercus]|uniref:XRE family transcriptional regulator n=1 Tax=Hansschlegelia quercus TaxID=2528245 RepID=A0A4V2JE17_9HYPH|nr:helix-turn-helix transcriptional regulator [Hansschlegelia quercus]TBN53506.1 XRE family transcriptional regulator [Hansschlegelia quercus]
MARDLRSPRYQRLRDLVVEARKAAGLSQANVAQRLKRPQSYVADIERNERRIDVTEFIALSEAVGFNLLSVLREVAEAPQT